MNERRFDAEFAHMREALVKLIQEGKYIVVVVMRIFLPVMSCHSKNLARKYS